MSVQDALSSFLAQEKCALATVPSVRREGCHRIEGEHELWHGVSPGGSGWDDAARSRLGRQAHQPFAVCERELLSCCARAPSNGASPLRVFSLWYASLSMNIRFGQIIMSASLSLSIYLSVFLSFLSFLSFTSSPHAEVFFRRRLTIAIFHTFQSGCKPSTHF